MRSDLNYIKDFQKESPSEYEKCLKEKNPQGRTPIWLATANECPKIIQHFLSDENSKKSINFQTFDIKSHCLVMSAVKHNSYKCLELLLKFGLDPNGNENATLVPLSIAAREGYVECLALLLKFNAVVDGREDMYKFGMLERIPPPNHPFMFRRTSTPPEFSPEVSPRVLRRSRLSRDFQETVEASQPPEPPPTGPPPMIINESLDLAAPAVLAEPLSEILLPPPPPPRLDRNISAPPPMPYLSNNEHIGVYNLSATSNSNANSSEQTPYEHPSYPFTTPGAQSPLHTAIIYNNEICARLLIAFGANLNLDYSENSIIWLCMRYKISPSLFKHICSLGAKFWDKRLGEGICIPEYDLDINHDLIQNSTVERLLGINDRSRDSGVAIENGNFLDIRENYTETSDSEDLYDYDVYDEDDLIYLQEPSNNFIFSRDIIMRTFDDSRSNRRTIQEIRNISKNKISNSLTTKIRQLNNSYIYERHLEILEKYYQNPRSLKEIARLEIRKGLLERQNLKYKEAVTDNRNGKIKNLYDLVIDEYGDWPENLKLFLLGL